MEAKTKDVAYFCPECGSASLDYSVLVGGAATCKVCNWFGDQSKLVAYQFQHDFVDSTEALRYFLNDVRGIYAASAKLFADILLKWGFLDYKRVGKELHLNSKQLARFLSAAAQASLKAIISERQKMEKERLHGS